MCAAHQGLASAVAHLIADAGLPITDALREAIDETASLRALVGRGEAELAALERKLSKSKRMTIRGVGPQGEGQ